MKSIKLGAKVAGAASVLLLSSAAFANFDGTNGRILLVNNGGVNGNGVFSVKPDGSNLHAHGMPLAIAGSDRAAFSPDGTKIAYVKGVSSTDFRIYISNADGSNAFEVTSGSVDYDPTWSPDGSSLAFVRDSASGAHIFTIGTDGQGLTQLTNTTSVDDATPTWSPDGTKIAYLKGNSQITEVAISAPNVETLIYDASPTALSDSGMDFSPDGAQIVYTAQFGTGGTDEAIHSVTVADGTDTVLVDGGDNYYKHSPSYSPDGTKLVYAAQNSSASADDHSRVFVAGADGSNPTAIYDSGDQSSTTYGGNILAVQWSTNQDTYTDLAANQDAGLPTLPKAGGLPVALSGLMLGVLALAGFGAITWSANQYLHRRQAE